MFIAQGISYKHPDKELLFENISFSIQKKDKVALIGNNGTGKSTLLKIIAGILQPSGGDVRGTSKPYYIPQHFGQFNDLTIAKALQTEDKLNALNEILGGNVSDKNLTLLNNDWEIEERVEKAMSYWKLKEFPLSYKMKDLSGGEKTKVFLAGIMVHNPSVILLDEPTNHLDMDSRKILYNYISTCNKSMVIVSHDRELLGLLNPVYELGKHGLKCYGGNYSFYKEQKEIEQNALIHQLEEKEKALQKAKKAEREALERKQRQDVRGKKKKQKEGVSRIMMKKLKNNAEQSSAKLKEKHSEKTSSISNELQQTRQKLPGISKIKMDFENSPLHLGKILVTAENVNFKYGDEALWQEPLNFQIRSGEKINIRGKNGSGKTTVIKLLLGRLQPTSGSLQCSELSSVYIDQDYSLIDNNKSVYEQAQHYNYDNLEEHDVKIRLNRYLFGRDSWDKPCSTLSGGEKMRLILCCLMISNHAPDLFVLDEPTNNLDIENIEILTAAISGYSGTILVISHDSTFLEEIGVTRIIDLDCLP